MKCPACERHLQEAPPIHSSAAPVHRAAAIEIGRYALLAATAEGELQAARMRSLPVITTCKLCAYCVADSESDVLYCDRDTEQRTIGLHTPPPEWCPMRGQP